jgi:Fe2+ transport system protein FeoA
LLDLPHAASAAGRNLGRARAGDKLRVLAVPAGHAAALAREGVVAGCWLEVETIVPLGGPVIARCGGARVALGRVVANGVFVEGLT